MQFTENLRNKAILAKKMEYVNKETEADNFR